MRFNLNDSIGLLSRTPNVLKAMLEGLPYEWTRQNEGEKTWSPYDVVGHLIHGERTDWIPRARIILEEDERQAFVPFDRFAQFKASKGKSLKELLRIFERLRKENVKTLKRMKLSDQDLRKKGRHPEFGKVTLKELLAAWVAHDQDHLVQIARTMAKQYQETVGPWQKYLSVLKK